MKKCGSVFFLAAILIFACGACSNAPHLKLGYQPPEEAADRYQDALRWKDFDSARALMAPEALAQFDSFVKDNSTIFNILEHTIIGANISQGGYLAQVKIRRSFYLSPSVNPREEELIQTWKLINGRWLLAGPPF